MADVTASVKVTQQASIGGVKVYQRDLVGNQGLGQFLKYMFGAGRYAGATITISSEVMTIPVGSILLLDLPDQMVLVEVITAITQTVSASLTKCFAQGGYDSSGNVKVVVDAAAATPSGALELATRTGASTLTENTALTKYRAKTRKWIVYNNDIGGVVRYGGYCPFAGSIISIKGAPGVTIDATTVVTGKINNVAITNGAVSHTNADAIGTVRSASPSAANVVKEGDYVEMVSDGAQVAVCPVAYVFDITE